MTEVTRARPVARPRPLGLLKDDSPYHRITSKFQNSKAGSKESNEKSNKTSQQIIKGTLQHAAIINIVAAVNEFHDDKKYSASDTTDLSDSQTDSLSNTMAVVSSIMTPRERTISIPTTQVVFALPEELVQRKPVYYKHSGDEEVHRKELVFSKDRPKLIISKPFMPSENAMKKMPFKTPCFIQKTETQSKKVEPETTKMVNNSKSWTPVRRLGAWKRSDSRTVHQISKCEAVDIMDADSIRRSQNEISVNPDPTKITSDEKLKIMPPTPPVNPFPFYRAKSLPVVFPVKTTKSTPSQTPRKPEKVKPRPLSRGYRSPSVDGRQVINLSGGFGTNSVNSGYRLNTDQDNISLFKLDIPKTKIAFQSQYSVTGSDVSPAEIRGKAFGQETPGHGLYAESTIGSENRLKSNNILQTKEHLHAAITFAMTGRPKSTSSSRSTASRSRNITSANSKKSCISNKSVTESTSGKRPPKKVKFARRPGCTPVVSVQSDEPVAKINAFGGSSIVQTQSSNITAYSLGPQPMSAQELLRLKQKFIPANVRVELANQPSYHFPTHTGMKIKSLHNRSNGVVPALSSSDSDRENSEEDRDIMSNGVVRGNSAEYSDDERKLSEGKVSKRLSDFDNETEDILSDEEFSGSESRQELKYNLLKAVDLDSYSEFEHKKMRKVLNSKNELAKTHSVKVTLKEGE